jgi:hypothetical protein
MTAETADVGSDEILCAEVRVHLRKMIVGDGG